MGLRKRKRDEAFPETPPSVEDIQMRENAQERARQQKIDNTIKEVLRRVNAALRSDKARYEIRGTGLHINSRLYGAEVCEYTGFSHYWVDPLLVALSKGPYKGYKVELVGLWDAGRRSYTDHEEVLDKRKGAEAAHTFMSKHRHAHPHIAVRISA